MFGLKEAEVAELVRSVSPTDLDRDAIEERFARATWTGIAEPGDRVAGAVIASIGAPRALAAVLERWTAEKLVDQLGEQIGEQATVSQVDAQKAIDRWQPRVNSGNALIALRQSVRIGVRLRVPTDEHWPVSLSDLEAHRPIALWTRGTDTAFDSIGSSIALVGARAATGYGEHVTMEASAGLVDRGYTIVSGAAYGIDGMAHRAALASRGLTVAFLAGGVDRFYPAGHDALLNRIVETGVVISELPVGSSPTKWRFLQRNRLIAAASRATIVLEAGWRSGSLNTAGHAAALGRPIGAVPGPVTSAASAGCHRLIREFNATCVTNADDMAELAPLESHAPAPAEVVSGATSEEIRVLDALSTRAPRVVSDLAARAGLAPGQVSRVLGRLELEQTVRERESGWLKVSSAAR